MVLYTAVSAAVLPSACQTLRPTNEKRHEENVKTRAVKKSLLKRVLGQRMFVDSLKVCLTFVLVFRLFYILMKGTNGQRIKATISTFS